MASPDAGYLDPNGTAASQSGSLKQAHYETPVSQCDSDVDETTQAVGVIDPLGQALVRLAAARSQAVN
jgi:hypothetical protein